MGMIGLGFSLIVEERLKMFDAYYATIMPITITLPYTLSPWTWTLSAFCASTPLYIYLVQITKGAKYNFDFE